MSVRKLILVFVLSQFGFLSNAFGLDFEKELKEKEVVNEQVLETLLVKREPVKPGQVVKEGGYEVTLIQRR